MSNLTYYNYKNEDRIAVDIETKDPLLISKGNGVYRKDGHVCGVSFSNGELAEYYPINHPDLSSDIILKNKNYITEQLLAPNRKLFANGLYDLDWLINFEKFKVNGLYDDIQIAEPLLDEYKSSYSLNNLAISYLNETKKPDNITQYAISQGWPLYKGSGINLLWKMPSTIVEEYAAEDARLTYKIFEKQQLELKAQNLEVIYNLEVALWPLLLQMRKQGVRLNKNELLKTGSYLNEANISLQKKLDELAEFEININSSKDLERLFKKLLIPIIYSEPTVLMKTKGKIIGNPCFNKKTLEKISHPIVKSILELRHIKTLLSLFIIPYPDLIINNRLHCNFNQLRSDDYGTVSGRFSSSNPNLQQVSGKAEEINFTDSSVILNGKIIRKLFIPEEGCSWLKHDWSQIEYRLIAHYAIGEGSEIIRQRYLENPETDYHTELGLMTGITDRLTVKSLNFGAAYGMGIKRMSLQYGWDFDEAASVYKMYHNKVPFVKETSRRVGLKAKKIGFVHTILNRRARLKDINKTYVMFNRLIQGSAADLMKQAMKNAYDAGIFNVLFPHLTVHDELDCSMPNNREGIEAAKELKYIMENCIKLRVPIISNVEIGPNWGELKKIEDLNKI